MPAPLQTALVAAPPIAPANCALGLLAQTAATPPAVTIAAGLIVMIVVETVAGQSPSVLAAVKLTVAVCAMISAVVGV